MKSNLAKRNSGGFGNLILLVILMGVLEVQAFAGFRSTLNRCWMQFTPGYRQLYSQLSPGERDIFTAFSWSKETKVYPVSAETSESAQSNEQAGSNEHRIEYRGDLHFADKSVRSRTKNGVEIPEVKIRKPSIDFSLHFSENTEADFEIVIRDGNKAVLSNKIKQFIGNQDFEKKLKITLFTNADETGVVFLKSKEKGIVGAKSIVAFARKIILFLKIEDEIDD